MAIQKREKLLESNKFNNSLNIDFYVTRFNPIVDIHVGPTGIESCVLQVDIQGVIEFVARCQLVKVMFFTIFKHLKNRSYHPKIYIFL